MYSVGAATLISGVCIIWLGVLTYLFWKEKGFLRELFPKFGERDIRNKFQELLGEIEDFRQRERVLTKSLQDLGRDGLGHLQKVEVYRYNPYNDTGGDQSFTFALLDGKLNGFLLTSLHSRAGTRVYTKTIKLGKSEIKLSKEEEEILRKAVGYD